MNIEDRLSALKTAAPEVIVTGTLLGTGLADGYRSFDSPVGTVAVTFNPDGVSSVDLLDDEIEKRFASRFGRGLIEATPPKGWDAKIGRAIERGTPGDLPVDLRSVTSFQRSVLEITAAIPRGEVRPYGWLAEQVGNPGAVRAVGSTMARNPVPLIIPCHRVVRSDGTIGNYSLGGADRKWRLLTVEGTDPARLEQLARKRVRYLGSDTTHIFCHPTCRHARRIGESHLTEFHSIDEAMEAGYRACRDCRP